MDQTTIIILMVSMFVCVVLIAGGGYYYTTTLEEEEDDDDKKTGSCEGMDVNGVYRYNDESECVFKGCKTGYYQQEGICIKSRNLSEEFLGGGGSLDCVVNGYTYGQCMNKVTSQPLTGETGNCGIGTRQKFPKVTASAIGQGKCEQTTTEDCEVSCPTTCNAPETLWVTNENTECRTIRNGQPIVLGSESGFCGQGTKIKTLSDSAITGNMLGTMSLDEYKSSINFSSCEQEKVDVCEVPCDENLINVGCPSSIDSWDWVYANQGAVYTSESAEKVIRREISIADAVLMTAISRQEAIDLGALNAETGVVDETKLPRGKRIKFKAGEEHSYQYLTEQNCSIVELEDAPAPRVAVNCDIQDVEGVCHVVGCGVSQQKTITPTVTKPAWGVGTCNMGKPYNVSCNIPEVGCCDPKYAGAWTSVEGYDGCELKDGVWKRKYTRQGHEYCQDVNVKFENDGSCKYDCAITSISLKDGSSIGMSMGGVGCSKIDNYREVDSVEIREAKGGKVCPTNQTTIGRLYGFERGAAIKKGDRVNNSSSITREYSILPTANLPDFTCGVNIKAGCGGITSKTGQNCQDGNAIPTTFLAQA